MAQQNDVTYTKPHFGEVFLFNIFLEKTCVAHIDYNICDTLNFYIRLIEYNPPLGQLFKNWSLPVQALLGHK
jgi:hypothetical protein